MPRIHNQQDLPAAPIPGKHPERWTAIIPAAGQAKRLNSSQPKILYPILGKPILHWTLDLLRPFCRSFVFVLSESSRAAVEPLLKAELQDSYRIAIQPEAKGMADAVLCSRESVKSENCLVLWGDQILLSKATIASCVALHEERPNAKLTFPTVIREKPYIAFTRDPDGRITGVREAREEALPIEQGENDCGLFLFQTQTLFKILGQRREDPLYRGKRTSEYNLLPLIPLFDQEAESVATLRIQNADESMGINTPDDGRSVEIVLKKRTGSTN